MLRVHVAKPMDVTYRLVVKCDVRLDDGLVRSPDAKVKPLGRTGTFEIVGDIRREIRPVGKDRFKLTDKVASLTVNTTGILKDQAESIKAQGKAMSKTLMIDSRGRYVGAPKDAETEFTPLYVPFATGGVLPGSRWTDVRTFGQSKITVEYHLTKGDISQEWNIIQRFKGNGLTSNATSASIFDAKTGIAKSGTLAYIQRDQGALSRITYDLKTIATK